MTMTKFVNTSCFEMSDSSFKEVTDKKGTSYFELKTDDDVFDEINPATGMLSIDSEMAAIDNKDRTFYDHLSEDEKKKFGTYTMIRWSASISNGMDELKAYYLRAANLRLNKDYFAVSDTNHKKLNWLLVTTVSPGMGKHRHQWVSAPKKVSSGTKVGKFLQALYPDLKNDELALLEKLNDVKTCKEHAEELGMTKEDIKKCLG